jgi:sulfate adenylyltransferase
MSIVPYGGQLIDRLIPDGDLGRHMEGRRQFDITLSHENIVNLTNIATGCFSPLTGFMIEAECRGVIENCRLPNGLDWTVPILLTVPLDLSDNLSLGDSLILKREDGETLACMHVESLFAFDCQEYCQAVFGTTSKSHPGVQDIMAKNTICAGGPVFVDGQKLEELRHFNSPVLLRERMSVAGSDTAIAFSTRNMCHLGHEYLHNIALETGDLLGINVITGAQVKGSFLPDVIFDTYEYLVDNFYPKGRVILNNLRLPPIYAGPKEAFLQATVLQNLGFTHFIIGRDHAGIGDFYPKYGSQEIFNGLKGLDITIMAISEPRFCKICDKITTERGCQHTGNDVKQLNGREVRRYLLEKRYDELEAVFRPELRDHVVQLFEEHADSDGDELAMRATRQIFFD